MAQLVTPSLEAETDADHLRVALAEVQNDLQRHGAILSRLQGELMASRLEVSGARAETVQFQGFLRRAEAEAAAAHAHIAELRANAASREAENADRHEAEIVRLRGRMDTLQAEIDALYASRSWRMSAPIRAASRIMRRSGRTAHRDFVDGANGFEYRDGTVSASLETTCEALAHRRQKSSGYGLRQQLRRLSWPVRWLWRRCRQALMARSRGNLNRSAPSPSPSAPGPVDPNERYIFRAAPLSGNAQGVVTLDRLHQLSRSL
jgi:hypothetical protein